MQQIAKTKRSISYAKWGYLFIAPFFITFIVFQLIPLISTIYNSLFEYYFENLKWTGPNFVGFKNYMDILVKGELFEYAGNTMTIWIVGYIPQILVAMLLAVWFTSFRLRLKFQSFFKTIIYMPNLIMASAFAMLFWMLFGNGGPVNMMLQDMGFIDQPIYFFDTMVTTRGIIAFMNFIMWFGNTMILLMAGIMGIDQGLFESAQIDGANSFQVFFKVTLPLLMPIVAYTVIVSMIGGIQMFDIPQVITNRLGNPDRTCMTLIMWLNRHLTTSVNYGLAGTISVIVFIATAILSIFVYKSLMRGYQSQTPVVKRIKRQEVKA